MQEENKRTACSESLAQRKRDAERLGLIPKMGLTGHVYKSSASQVCNSSSESQI